MVISAEIFEGCRRQERPAQEQLYQRCYPDLMRVALRYVHNEADAADILNRAMFKAFTRIAQFGGTADNFGGWLLRILVHEALDFLRARPAAQANQPLEEALHLSSGLRPDSARDAEDILALLRRLPATTAAVFNLFALEGYSHQEISAMLDISAANSRWHLHSARQKLQQWIAQTAAA
jgi:RNA polymerase sigma-70 factor (ECF subfamily)